LRLLNSRLRAAELLPLVPAAAIPLLFLHVRYQPHVSLGRIDVFGSDVAAAVTVGAAIVAGIWWGFEPLRRARVLWAVAGSLLVLYGASCFWDPLGHVSRNLITAAKLAEYALLSPAVVLLLRRRVDVERFLLAFVGWSAAASGWGLLQFLGLVNEFSGKRPGQREVSFLGIHDFAGFSAAALALAFAGIALGDRRLLVVVAAVAGTIGSILAASAFAFSGILVVVVLVAVAGRRAGTLTVRRAVAVAAITLAVGGGVFELRASDATRFFSFLGHAKPTAVTSEDVQTGSQRVLLGYIGLRIWEAHPVFGIGLEGSKDGYKPYIAAAKRRFPHQAPTAFPSPERRLGVQNLWIQTLADVGIVGLLLTVGTFAAGLLMALRARKAGLPALVAASWILVAAATWNAVGLIAGLPLDALTWLGFGLAATVGGLE
jgi:hypothetical protein